MPGARQVQKGKLYVGGIVDPALHVRPYLCQQTLVFHEEFSSALVVVHSPQIGVPNGQFPLLSCCPLLQVGRRIPLGPIHGSRHDCRTAAVEAVTVWCFLQRS
jgi:hypothetical protein